MLALLHKEIRIEKIVLEHPSISIDRDADGTSNLERSGGRAGNPISLMTMTFSLLELGVVGAALA